MKELIFWVIFVVVVCILNEWKLWPYIICMIPLVYEIFLKNILQRGTYYLMSLYVVLSASYITALFYDIQNHRIGWLVLDITPFIGIFRGFYIWLFA